MEPLLTTDDAAKRAAGRPGRGGGVTLPLSSRASRVIRAIEAIMVIGLIALAGNLLFGLGSPGLDDFFYIDVYIALIVAAGFVCLARVVIVPEHRAGWLMVGLALFANALAEVYWLAFLGDQASPPYPSVSDLGWLGWYPFMFAGIALLIRSRVRGFRAVFWLDGLIGALAIGAVGAAFLLPPILESATGSSAAIATTIAYPIGDLITLAFVAALLVMTGWRPEPSWGMLALGLVVVAVGDTVYEYQIAIGTYGDRSWLDVIWPLVAVLIALAAWRKPQRSATLTVSGWRGVAAPAWFSLVAIAVLVYGYFTDLDVVAMGLAVATLLAIAARMGITYRDNERLSVEVQTDSLTGLCNRGKLMIDLREEFEAARSSGPRVLAMFDLDGFKLYNDTFGHPAGDALLKQLSTQLATAVHPEATPYRIGGDEFCVLIPDAAAAETTTARAAKALSASGDGFEITCSYGSARIPDEAETPEHAFQLVDERMYLQKNSSRMSARNQAQQVLMRALRERQPELSRHVDQVSELAKRTARRFSDNPEELDVIYRAAQLHDIGKMAVPDAILDKAGALDESEWGFIREHTVVGGRILESAPALAPVAMIVRSSHERWDGNGYPDGLAGTEIPLGARIVFACDAFQAMTTDRAYSAALSKKAAVAELRRCAGSQFDPEVVEMLCEEIAAGGLDPEPSLRELSTSAG